MSDQPQKTPLVELLRAIPKDLRAEWPSQWDYFGNPTGHTLSPVGKHCHEAADEITSLKAQLAAERERVERLREDAERYRWIRDKYEWRRHGNLPEEDSYAFVGCRFPYLANFECKAMLDYNIDQMRNALADTQEMTLDDHTRMAFEQEED